VNDAASGDTINIASGRYTENVSTAGKALTFVGESAASTLVYAANRGPVFTLGSAVAGDPPLLITIQGLTISHGTHTGGTGVGGGVQVRAGSYLHIENSTIVGNFAASGAGIGIDSPGAPATTITSCLIDGNFAGGSLLSGTGGGVEVRPGSAVSIQQSYITRNSATRGGGVYGWNDSAITVAGTTVSGNFVNPVSRPTGPSGGEGGGIDAHGTMGIDSSYILNNVANGENGGGGLFLLFDSNGVTTISNTIVAQNSGSPGGIYAVGGTLALQNSYVIQNNFSGITGSVVLSLSGTTIKDNVGLDICLPNNCGP